LYNPFFNYKKMQQKEYQHSKPLQVINVVVLAQ